LLPGVIRFCGAKDAKRKAPRSGGENQSIPDKRLGEESAAEGKRSDITSGSLLPDDIRFCGAKDR
jgi:hypothetical protein